METPVYTKELPTKPGYYWMNRLPLHKNAPFQEIVRVYPVVINDIDQGLHVLGNNWGYPLVSIKEAYSEVQWAGPLTPPAVPIPSPQERLA